jgi:hypothetical protein
MTRTEAEALIRSVDRTCKGRFINPPDYRLAVMQTYRDVCGQNDYAEALRFVRSFEAEAKMSEKTLRDGDFEALEIRLLEVVFAHNNDCGYDINLVILSNSLDGQTYKYTCPQCGYEGEYQAASIESRSK